MLSLTNISKLYRGPESVVRALDTVTLGVEPGEFVSVQGPSGCGKTTLLLAAGGLLAPDEGSVLVDQKNPYGLPSGERAHFRAETIGFVFQQFHLVPYLSVLDNVLAPEIALNNVNSRKRAEELVARFRLNDRTGHLPAALSTGERQRTALARALLNKPRLLLADEPTGNLDSDNADIVLDTLAGFAESGGAVLMVTHSPEVASRAYRAVYLQNGRIVGP